MKRLFPFLKSMVGLFILALVLLLVARLLAAYIPYGAGRLIDRILARDFAIFPTLYTLIALLVAADLLYLSNIYLMNFIGQRAIFKIRSAIFRHILSLHVGFFDDQKTGQLMSRTIADVERIQRGVGETLITTIGAFLMILFILIAIFFVQWQVALTILCVTPLLIILSIRFGYQQRRAFQKVRKTLGNLNAFLQEQLLGARIIRNFDLQAEERLEFDRINQRYCRQNIETIRHIAFFFASMDWTQVFTLALVLSGLLLFTDSFNPGDFFAFNFYIMMLYRPIIQLVENYNVIQEARAAADRIAQILDTPSQIKDQSTQTLQAIDEIIFDNVHFRYKEEPILRGISFTLKSPQTIALVGPTGGGKSTVLSLLLRFYEPQKGQILINQRPLQTYSIKSLRAAFATVLQESDPTEAASTGERQLMALDEAMQSDGLLLLDEATANIDLPTEAKIQKDLNKIFTSRSALVIAHRLSTVSAADQILVLHHGEIIERGDHESLLKEDGFYSKLYRRKIL